MLIDYQLLLASRTEFPTLRTYFTVDRTVDPSGPNPELFTLEVGGLGSQLVYVDFGDSQYAPGNETITTSNDGGYITSTCSHNYGGGVIYFGYFDTKGITQVNMSGYISDITDIPINVTDLVLTSSLYTLDLKYLTNLTNLELYKFGDAIAPLSFLSNLDIRFLSNLSSLTVKNSELGNIDLYGLSNLTSMTLNHNVSLYTFSAKQDCISLTYLDISYCGFTTPEQFHFGNFRKIDGPSCTLYIEGNSLFNSKFDMVDFDNDNTWTFPNVEVLHGASCSLTQFPDYGSWNEWIPPCDISTPSSVTGFSITKNGSIAISVSDIQISSLVENYPKNITGSYTFNDASNNYSFSFYVTSKSTSGSVNTTVSDVYGGGTYSVSSSISVSYSSGTQNVNIHIDNGDYYDVSFTINYISYNYSSILYELDLSSNDFSTGLAVASFTNLTILRVNNCLLDENIIDLSGLPLAYLSASYNNFYEFRIDGSVARINLPGLTYLRLSYNDLLVLISTNSTLNYLYVDNCPLIVDPNLDNIVTTLTHFDCHNCPTIDSTTNNDFITSLVNYSNNLIYFDVSNCNIIHDINDVSKIIVNNSNIEEVYANDNIFGGKFTDVISIPKLVHVSIANQVAKGGSVTHFSWDISTDVQDLLTIDASNNDIGDFQINGNGILQSLITLDVSYNSISSWIGGVVGSIPTDLQYMPSIKNLIVSNNPINVFRFVNNSSASIGDIQLIDLSSCSSLQQVNIGALGSYNISLKTLNLTTLGVTNLNDIILDKIENFGELNISEVYNGGGFTTLDLDSIVSFTNFKLTISDCGTDLFHIACNALSPSEVSLSNTYIWKLNILPDNIFNLTLDGYINYDGPYGHVNELLITYKDDLLAHMAAGTIYSGSVTITGCDYGSKLEDISYTSIGTVGGSYPFGIACNPNSGFPYLYVCNQNAASVSKIATNTNGLSNTISLSSYCTDVFAIAYATVHNEMWVTSPGSNKIIIISCSGDTVATTITVTTPIGITYDSNNDKMWVTSYTNNIYVIDCHSRTVTHVSIGKYSHQSAIDNQNDVVYITNHLNNSVTVVSAITLSIITSISTDTPIGIGYSSVSKKIYIGNSTGIYKVSVLDANSSSGTYNTLISYFARISNESSYSMTYDVTRNHMYVTNLNYQTVDIIDCASDTYIESITTPGRPSGSGFDSTNKKVYITYYDGYVMDLGSKTRLYTQPFGDLGILQGRNWNIVLDNFPTLDQSHSNSFSTYYNIDGVRQKWALSNFELLLRGRPIGNYNTSYGTNVFSNLVNIYPYLPKNDTYPVVNNYSLGSGVNNYSGNFGYGSIDNYITYNLSSMEFSTYGGNGNGSYATGGGQMNITSPTISKYSMGVYLKEALGGTMGIMGNMNGSLMDGMRYAGSTLYYGLGATALAYSGSLSTGLLSINRVDNTVELYINSIRLVTTSQPFGSYLNHTPAVHNINVYSGGTYSPTSINTKLISGFYTGTRLTEYGAYDLAAAWDRFNSQKSP
jgi:hypothetical protein